jgi:hypothetical protein
MLELCIGYGKRGDAKFQNRVFKSERGEDPVTVHSWWGEKNLEKWGVASVIDGLRSVLSEEPGVFVIDGAGGEANPRNLRVSYTTSTHNHVRLRLQGVPYPVVAGDLDVSKLLCNMGFVESPVPRSVSELACWLGYTPVRNKLVVALHEHIAPTKALLEQLRQGLSEYGDLRLLVLYFYGSPPSGVDVDFKRIPFDADRD